MTANRFEHDNYYKYDLREPPRKIVNPDRIKTHVIDHLTDDWSNIPFYPTNERRKEMIEKYGEKNANEIIQYSYDNSTDPTKEVIPPTHQIVRPNSNLSNLQNQLNIIQQYIKQSKSNNMPPNVNVPSNVNVPPNVNKFSPAYARIIGAKPKATASASIRLGGVYR
jgi:hypothetical protein